jgi:hypothetical protein
LRLAFLFSSAKLVFTAARKSIQFFSHYKPIHYTPKYPRACHSADFVLRNPVWRNSVFITFLINRKLIQILSSSFSQTTFLNTKKFARGDPVKLCQTPCLKTEKKKEKRRES